MKNSLEVTHVSSWSLMMIIRHSDFLSFLGSLVASCHRSLPSRGVGAYRHDQGNLLSLIYILTRIVAACR